LGLIVGVMVALAGITVYHEIKGWHHLSVWERSLEERHLERSGALMLGHVELATTAIEEGAPVATSEFLSSELMQRLYRHHMDHACALLRGGQVERFNELKAPTSFVLFDLSGRDLSGLDLEGVNLMGADLSGVDLSGANLTDANLALADLTGANLDSADLSRASFVEANLSDAILNRVHGTETNLYRAVLASTSMMQIDGLEGAMLEGAILAQANLWQSRFPGASLDHVDMTITSAVDADLSGVRSMDDAVLTGANLAGAQLEPERMRRAWFVNAEGVSPSVATALRRQGGVSREEGVLDLVDPRIVAGFRAQVEEDERILDREKHAALFRLLQGYYLR